MYQVLYRKYRPKVFSDVVGQEHITKTLLTEIETGKLSHAYLFTGSRGTGKTTCAKILSKAVNCLHPVDGNPCNECEICKGIDSGAILDVLEIDAASNNGVDNIRDIRDEAAFAPASCKYRVYIIDEVHMLSIGAFNALLKTLEEPPAHVKFILATTEVHKLPVTILSRCQRFDFKRVGTDAMISRMMHISEKEGFVLTEDAASLIARLSDGGMRDALSLLDQCTGRGKDIDDSLVREVAGITGKDHLFSLADAVSKNDSGKCIDIINELHSSSFDMERLCSDLIGHMRNLMIVKTVKDAANVLICTKEEIEGYKTQSKLFTLETILYCIDLLQLSLANIKKGVNRRIEMEMAVIRMASPKLDTNNKAILRRISDLELLVKSGKITVNSAPEQNETQMETPKEGAPSVQKEEESVPAQAQQKEISSAPAVKETAEKSAPALPDECVPFADWPAVLAELKELNGGIWGILTGSSAYIRNDFVLVNSNNPTFPMFIKTGSNSRDVKEAVYRVTGRKYRLGIFKAQAAAETPLQSTEKPKDALENFISKARDLGVNVDIK